MDSAFNYATAPFIVTAAILILILIIFLLLIGEQWLKKQVL